MRRLDHEIPGHLRQCQYANRAVEGRCERFFAEFEWDALALRAARAETLPVLNGYTGDISSSPPRNRVTNLEKQFSSVPTRPVGQR
jgi:hypothetical protein